MDNIKFVLDSGVYTEAGDKIVIEICKRMGWKVNRVNGDLVIEYPEQDQDIFEMLEWESENTFLNNWGKYED